MKIIHTTFITTSQQRKMKLVIFPLALALFFAEVSHKLGEDALEVNCCCKIEDEDNGIA